MPAFGDEGIYRRSLARPSGNNLTASNIFISAWLVQPAISICALRLHAQRIMAAVPYALSFGLQ
jgi:hypothetical protein